MSVSGIPPDGFVYFEETSACVGGSSRVGVSQEGRSDFTHDQMPEDLTPFCDVSVTVLSKAGDGEISTYCVPLQR